MPISSSMLDVLNSTSRLFKADDRFYSYKKEKSDFVIENNSDIANLQMQIEKVLSILI
jgi:dephospho-CoA kinase